MAFGKTKTPEQLAEEEARRVARDWEAFWNSPQGQARQSYEAGNDILQISFDVMTQQGNVQWMVGASAPQRTADPTVTLNLISREGWELVNGSFVFVQQREKSRDKFASSGQNVAIEGTTVGYYLFRRNPALKRD